MDKRKKWLIAGLVAVQSITAVFWLIDFADKPEPVRVLERNVPGGGDSGVMMEVKTESGRYPVHIVVEERDYREDELEQIFEQGKSWLDKVWLGDNLSSDEVTENLYFPTQIENSGLNIRWFTEDYRLLQPDGTITEEAKSKAPLTITARAVLSYGSMEKEYNYTFTLISPLKDEEELFLQSVQEAADTAQIAEKTSDKVLLPETVEGRTLTWYRSRKSIWPKLCIFGNIIVVLLYFSRIEQDIHRMKNRERALNGDYPDIVYRMVLLIGSGMTVRGAWEKMISDYRKWRENRGKLRWGYEEMETALREMNYGVPELKAYENFGQRCGMQNYIRLSSMLVQQVKRGSPGMNQLLMREVAEAEIIRRENARRTAEEAGTRLLVPMILLMIVVFAVLMIPAFLSMNI